MTTIVEDGTIVADANSYVSDAELTEYATARGVALTATPAQLIVQSMDYLETRYYIGVPTDASQELSWPRRYVRIDGNLVDPNSIPKELKNAQMATCMAIDSGYDPSKPIEPSVKREKVDVLETEYQDGAMSSGFDPKINAYLSKLTKASGGSTFNVVRA